MSRNIDWNLWSNASKLAVAMYHDGAWSGDDATHVCCAVMYAPKMEKGSHEHRELSAAVERISALYRDTLDAMPGRYGVKFNEGGSIMPSKGTDKAASRWLNANFNFLGPFLFSRRNAEQETADRKAFHSHHVSLLALTLDQMIERTARNDFFKSLREQLDRKGWLSYKQLDCLSRSSAADFWVDGTENTFGERTMACRVIGDFSRAQARGWDRMNPLVGEPAKPWEVCPV